eukprot:3816780-Pyramimonas_sp.AAC.2
MIFSPAQRTARHCLMLRETPRSARPPARLVRSQTCELSASKLAGIMGALVTRTLACGPRSAST